MEAQGAQEEKKVVDRLNSKLTEGLRTGDLEFLISSTISIDEFESKIDSDAIVVGLYVDDDEPADDLLNFIEGDPADILDVEVSPAPDEKGRYVVFVEFLRDEKFSEKLDNVLSSLESLTKITEWKYTYYGSHGKEKDYDMKNITNDIRLEKKPENEEMPANQKESLDFFKPSILDDVKLDGTKIELTRHGKNIVLEKVALGDPTLLFDALELNDKPIDLDAESLRKCNNIRRMLGENWDVNRVADHYILANDKDENILIVK